MLSGSKVIFLLVTYIIFFSANRKGKWEEYKVKYHNTLLLLSPAICSLHHKSDCLCRLFRTTEDKPEAIYWLFLPIDGFNPFQI